MSAFSRLKRPPEMLDYIPGGYSGGRSGFQGAHIIGKAFWRDNLDFLNDVLEHKNARNFSFNGVLLPETELGGAVMNVASHNSSHVDEFNQLVYNTNYDPNIPDSGKNRPAFFNRFEHEYQEAREEAEDLGQDEVHKVNAQYALKFVVYEDFFKIHLMGQKVLNKLADEAGIDAEIKSIYLNDYDYRYDDDKEVSRDLQSIIDSGYFEPEAVENHPLYQQLKALRLKTLGLEEAEDGRILKDGQPVRARDITRDIDAHIVEKYPQTGRIIFDDINGKKGDVNVPNSIRADWIARKEILEDILGKRNDATINEEQREEFEKRVASPAFERRVGYLEGRLDCGWKYDPDTHKSPYAKKGISLEDAVRVLDQDQKTISQNPENLVDNSNLIASLQHPEAVNMFRALHKSGVTHLDVDINAAMSPEVRAAQILQAGAKAFRAEGLDSSKQERANEPEIADEFDYSI